MKRLVLICLLFVALVPPSGLSAQGLAFGGLATVVPEVDSVPTQKSPRPSMVWQSPLYASLTATSFALGVSPFFSDYAYRQNRFVREQFQMVRRNHFGHRALTFDNFLQAAPIVSVVGLDLLGVKGRHDSWSICRRSFSAGLTVLAYTETVKRLVDEKRPDYSASNSFPSGHTAFAFAGAELLRLEYSDASVAIPIAGFVAASLCGMMRIYNDRHWLSDVLAGAAFGVVAADLSWLLNNWLDDKLTNKNR